MSSPRRHPLPPLLLLVATVIVLLAQSRSASQAPSRIPEGLLARAQAEGAVRVIVGVRAPFTPEGDLAGPDAVREQREAIRLAQQTVLDQLPRGSTWDVKLFETIPFFAAVVDSQGLEILGELSEVTSIEEDRLAAPMLAEASPIVQAPQAWARGFTGSGHAVAILDTGVDKNHSFFGGRVVSEACYSTTWPPDSATSVCPGGFNSTAPGSGVNCSAGIWGCDHGTHVAGIAAGSGLSAGVSFSGVARNASIIAIQVFSRFDSSALCRTRPVPCALSYSRDQVFGLQRVFELRNSLNIAAANMSIVGAAYTNQLSCDAANPSTKAAIDNLRSVGIATVIASGNDFYINAISAPGCISSAVSVGSTRDGSSGAVPVDSVSFFSNSAAFLSLLAPGEWINSSVPGGAFSNFRGTSMATPMVAGAWAVLKQRVPTAGVSQVLTALQSTGTAVVDWRNGLTFRRINVNAALDALGPGTSPPGPPSNLTASVFGSTVTFSWSGPTTGGTPTTYVLELGSSPGASNLLNRETGSTVTSFTLSGVGSGTHYARVRARNSGGTSLPSNEVTFARGGLAPGPPNNLTASVSGSTVTFRWTAPTTGGTPTSYVLQAGSSPGASNLLNITTGGTATTYTVINFPSGASYVRVRAFNGAGTSGPSNEVTVVVGCVPSAPTSLAAAINGSTVTLSWNASSGGPTSYVIEAGSARGASNLAVIDTGTTTTTFTATNVPPGSYWVRVRARNGCGLSGPSNELLVWIL